MDVTPSLAQAVERLNQMPDKDINAVMDAFDALIIQALMRAGLSIQAEQPPAPTGAELN